nr:hypothetical protein [Candidatus Omnitrophota bacterium]
MAVISVERLSQIPIDMPHETDWQPGVSEDFKGPQYFKNIKDIRYLRHLGNYGEIAPMAGICHQNKILLFIAGQNKPMSFRNSIRIILLYFFRCRGFFALHTAYLTKDKVSILFPGNSGCGKTTISMNLAKSGFICRGDDISFLCRSNSKIKAYPFPTRMLRRDYKKDTRVCIRHKTYYKTASTPDFIVFPEITHKKKSKLIPLSSNEAMMKIIGNLMFSSLEPVRDDHVKAMEILKKLVKQCCSYLLLGGKDIIKSPTNLSLILKRLIKHKYEDMHY